jgi:hypothetical protein
MQSPFAVRTALLRWSMAGSYYRGEGERRLARSPLSGTLHQNVPLTAVVFYGTIICDRHVDGSLRTSALVGVLIVQQEHCDGS